MKNRPSRKNTSKKVQSKSTYLVQFIRILLKTINRMTRIFLVKITKRLVKFHRQKTYPLIASLENRTASCQLKIVSLKNLR